MHLLKKSKKYIFKHPAFMRALAWFIHLYLRLAFMTMRWQVIYKDEDITEHKPTLLTFWHQKLAFGVCIFGKYCLNKKGFPLVSPHKDGKIIGDILNFFGLKNIEGSSNNQANSALKEIIRCLRNNKKIVITPDGPRGPAKQINSSICEISKKYHAPILPANCYASSCYTLNSWDKMQIPKPFSKVVVIYGKLFCPRLSKAEDDEQLSIILQQLEQEAKIICEQSFKANRRSTPYY